MAFNIDIYATSSTHSVYMCTGDQQTDVSDKNRVKHGMRWMTVIDFSMLENRLYSDDDDDDRSGSRWKKKFSNKNERKCSVKHRISVETETTIRFYIRTHTPKIPPFVQWKQTTFIINHSRLTFHLIVCMPIMNGDLCLSVRVLV